MAFSKVSRKAEIVVEMCDVLCFQVLKVLTSCFMLVPKPIDLFGSRDALRFAKVSSRGLYCENKMYKHKRSTCNTVYLFLYRTYHIVFHGGLQFFRELRSDISGSRRFWLPLSVHF